MKRIIIIIILVSVGFVLSSDIFIIKDIEYNKCEYFNDPLTDETLGKNLNFLKDNKTSIKEKIVKLPIVESAIVEKKFPNKLKIDIIYKSPFLKIVDNNINIVIDNNGYVLAINRNIKTDYYIDGLEISYYKINEKLKVSDGIIDGIIDLVKLINKSGVDIKSRMQYNNYNVILKTVSGIEVKFGDCSDIEKKFNDFINVYHDLQSKNIGDGIIDVSIPDLPLFKKVK